MPSGPNPTPVLPQLNLHIIYLSLPLALLLLFSFSTHCTHARTHRNNFGAAPVPKRGYGTEEYSEETLADLIAQLESTQKEVSQVTIWYDMIWYLSLPDRIHCCSSCLIQRRFKHSITSNIALHCTVLSCHVVSRSDRTWPALFYFVRIFASPLALSVDSISFLSIPFHSIPYLSFPFLPSPTAWCRRCVDEP